MSSINNVNYDMYQLDRLFPGAGLSIGAWCPKSKSFVGHDWIQVATDTLKYLL